MVMWMKARLRPDLDIPEEKFTPEQLLKFVDELERKHLTYRPPSIKEIETSVQKLYEAFIERRDNNDHESKT